MSVEVTNYQYCYFMCYVYCHVTQKLKNRINKEYSFYYDS